MKKMENQDKRPEDFDEHWGGLDSKQRKVCLLYLTLFSLPHTVSGSREDSTREQR